MNLKDFKEIIKGLDDDTEIIIRGNQNFYVRYVNLIYDNPPPGTMISSEVFYKKRLEIELYR